MDGSSGDGVEAAEAFLRLGDELVDQVERVLVPWWQRCIARFDRALAAESGPRCDGAARTVVEELRSLVAIEADLQQRTPLEVLRRSTAVPTTILRQAGTRPVERDEFEMRRDPDDVYGLSPASFGDVDVSLVEAGIAWGAAKAFVHRLGRAHD